MSATRANGRSNETVLGESRISALLKGREAAREPEIMELTDSCPDDPTPRAAIMDIGPEVAERILEGRNKGNRKISPYRVKMVCEELSNGRWKVNGETIIFDAEGSLKNGQHRLTACLQMGIPLRTWVVFGVDPGCFDTLDRGRNRQTSDDMAILGEKNYCLLPSTLAMVWLDEREQIEHVGQTTSSQVLQEVLGRHPGIRAHVDWVSAKKLHKIINPSVAAFLRYRFSDADPVAAIKFFDDLSSGAGLDAGDPVLALRNRMMDDRASRAKLPKFEVLVLAIKAWNHRRAGRKISVLTWRQVEGFPVIQ